jgi:hypothetical protein
MSLTVKQRKALYEINRQLAKMDDAMRKIKKNYTLVRESKPYPDGSVTGSSYKIQNAAILTSEHTTLPLSVEYIEQVDWLGLGFTSDATPSSAVKIINAILDGEV